MAGENPQSVKTYENVCAVIPCHNEARNIGDVLEDVKAAIPGATIVVVDDASTDATFFAASAHGAVVLSLPVNLGIGGAVQAGFKYAVRNKFRYVIRLDGDGQHLADEIPELLKPVMEDEADLVIGSRFIGSEDGFKSTFLRRMGIGLFCLINSLIVKKLITDNTSGFRAYGPEALLFAARHYPAFDYPEPEEIILMGRNKFRLLEVPVKMAARAGGVSSINFKRSIYYMAKVLLAVLMMALRPSIRRSKEAN